LDHPEDTGSIAMLPLRPMPPTPPGTLQVLVVSSWYPSAADPVAGRFVADGVAALHDRGVVAPAVVSFDPADLIGSGPVRARIARAVHAHVGAAVRSTTRLFVPLATMGPTGPAIPIARLGIPSGRYREAGATHARSARVPALEALADRWVRGIEADVPRPDLVHAHTVYPDGAAAARLGLGLGCPLVLTEHASAVARLIAAPEVRASYLETVRAAARLIVVSHSLAGELIAAMPEIEPKVVVVPNGVSMDDYRAAPIGERRPDELLFVGYRKPTKGISTLLRAVALARGAHPGITLRLIGGSPTHEIEAGWHREAVDLGILDIVRFEGPADRRGVAEAMARASLFVHPSPRETFGVVAVEALASGLPVIAADSGGVTEILADRPDALGGLVPPDRPDLLAAAIGSALDRRETFDPAALRASVEARFAATTVAARLEAIYAEATAEREPQDLAPAPPAIEERAARRVVVALDPARAAEAARLSAAAEPPATTLVLVATAAWIDPGSAFGRVVRLTGGIRISGLADAAVLRSGRGGIGRWLQLLRHPLALARRRGWLGGVEAAATKAGDAAIREAIRGAAAEQQADAQAAPAMIELVCADGIDHLAAEAVISEGLARPWPGGLRRLGDVLAAAEGRRIGGAPAVNAAGAVGAVGAVGAGTSVDASAERPG
jgi:glycosyltransferase involved in cell wall biosynthesis